MSETRYTLSRDEKCLIAKAQDSEDRKISEDCVIDVFPPYAHHGCHQLVYVDVAGEPAGTKAEQRTTLKVIGVLDPSEDILEQFSARSQWFLPALLENSSDHPNLHIIISGKSGGEHARLVYDNLVQPYLSALGLKEEKDYSVQETASADTISNFTKDTLLPRARSGIHQSVILLSGDGGIVDLVNGLLGDGTPTNGYIKPQLAILPMGTGNALAHSTLVTSDQTLGLSTLARGRPKALPIFRAHFSAGARVIEGGEALPEPADSRVVAAVADDDGLIVYGAVVFSYGLHASLVGDSDTPEYRKHGAQRFQMAAQNLLKPPNGEPPHAYRARVSVRRKDEQTWTVVEREEQAYVLATFASQLEAGFTISPASKPLDGQLRLVHFGPLEGGGDAIMDIMMKAYGGGKHADDERVEYDEVEGVKIDFDVENGEEEEKWRRVCVDGKIFVVSKRGNVVVEKEESAVVDLVTLAK